ncbi:MAG: hypothetical protein GY906_00155 [bacterium]|nr:hypothetical protein [bacterium]
MVLTIVGMTLAVALPAFHRNRVRSHTMHELEKITSLVNVARFQALNRANPCALEFVINSNHIRLFEEAVNSDLQLNAGEEVFRTTTLNELFEYSRPDGPTAIDLAGGNSNVLQWQADGSLTPTLTFSVTPAVYIANRSGDHFRIRFNSVTGVAKIDKWESVTNKWQEDRRDWVWSTEI